MIGLIVEERGAKARLTEIDPSRLPPGDVVVDVSYSSLNYKDSLAMISGPPVVRDFPMVPGIDLVGRVAESQSSEFAGGDWVVVNGWGMGETRWGGFADTARVESGMLIHLPAGMSPFNAMAVGTAGYTAMLCAMALEEQGVGPSDGPILVTGATGGVGLVSVLVLSELGYTVVASTGKDHMADTLTDFGAGEVVGRFSDEDVKPLSSERWAGAIDTVGSKTLAAVLAATRRDGVVAACGLAQGSDLPTTVMPFILRGVALVGVDSVYQPRDVRTKAWDRLAKVLDFNRLNRLSVETDLSEISRFAERQLAGDLSGRVVVRCSDESGHEAGSS